MIQRSRRQKCARNVCQLSRTTASMNYVFVCFVCILFDVCFVCLNVFVPCACSSPQGQQRVVDLLGVKLQVVVSGHTDAGTRAQVLWMNSKCSFPLVSLSSHQEGVRVE